MAAAFKATAKASRDKAKAKAKTGWHFVASGQGRGLTSPIVGLTISV